MVQQLTRDGNFLNLVLNASPIGLIASTTCSWSLHRSANNICVQTPTFPLHLPKFLTNKQTEQSVWRSISLFALVPLSVNLSHFLNNFLFLISCKQVWNLHQNILL